MPDVHVSRDAVILIVELLICALHKAILLASSRSLFHSSLALTHRGRISVSQAHAPTGTASLESRRMLHHSRLRIILLASRMPHVAFSRRDPLTSFTGTFPLALSSARSALGRAVFFVSPLVLRSWQHNLNICCELEAYLSLYSGWCMLVNQ